MSPTWLPPSHEAGELGPGTKDPGQSSGVLYAASAQAGPGPHDAVPLE